MLTDQQVLHFKTFGFIALPGLFPPDEMAEIEREFEEVVVEERQGRPFLGEKRQAVMAFAELRPKLMSLLDDDRIYEPMEQLLGPDCLWWGSDGNLYVGDTTWHPDAADRRWATAASRSRSTSTPSRGTAAAYASSPAPTGCRSTTSSGRSECGERCRPSPRADRPRRR